MSIESHQSSATRAMNDPAHARRMMEKYNIFFDTPLDTTKASDLPINLVVTFKNIQALGRTVHSNYVQDAQADTSRARRLQRSQILFRTAANYLETEQIEPGWRGVERMVFSSMEDEVSCKICQGRRFRSELEVPPSEETEYGSEKRTLPLEIRQKRRKLCQCPTGTIVDGLTDTGINPVFGVRREGAIVYPREMQDDIGRRYHRPDLIYGLRPTHTIEHLLNQNDRREQYRNKRIIDSIRTTPFSPHSNSPMFPFLIVEAKSAKSPATFRHVDRQTAFPIRQLVRLQEDLRMAAADFQGREGEGSPLVWYFSYRGEQWRLHAAFPGTDASTTSTRVRKVWSGDIDTANGALQLVLLADYICDWARDNYREWVTRSLAVLSESDRHIADNADSVISSLRLPPAPSLYNIKRQGTYSIADSINEQGDDGPSRAGKEVSVLPGLDSDFGALRDIRHIRSIISGVYITSDNFDLLVSSTSSDEEFKTQARKILSLLKASFKVEKAALDALEVAWSGCDRCGLDSVPPDRKFLMVASISAYLTMDWEPSRKVFWLAVDETLIDRLVKSANVHRSTASSLRQKQAVSETTLVSSVNKYRCHSARDNLLACLMRADVFVGPVTPEHLFSLPFPRPSDDSDESDSHVGAFVLYLRNKHTLGRAEPTSSLFRKSSRVDCVPLVDTPSGSGEWEMLRTPLWPLSYVTDKPRWSSVDEPALLVAADAAAGVELSSPVCAFAMEPVEMSLETHLRKILACSGREWRFLGRRGLEKKGVLKRRNFSKLTTRNTEMLNKTGFVGLVDSLRQKHCHFAGATSSPIGPADGSLLATTDADSSLVEIGREEFSGSHRKDPGPGHQRGTADGAKSNHQGQTQEIRTPKRRKTGQSYSLTRSTTMSPSEDGTRKKVAKSRSPPKNREGKRRSPRLYALSRTDINRLGRRRV